MKRAVLIVLDGVGIGELPDAALYGDEGTNTLSHVIAAAGGLELPALASLGLGNIPGVEGIPPAADPAASFGRMAEKSAGKHSTTGHWELAGLVVAKAFPTYPDGFPESVVRIFEREIGKKTLGNFPCSGTEIIERLGKEHLETRRPIIYTSADSVFQVAAHEDVMTNDELYLICEKARALLKDEHAVSRVIARPFEGEPGAFRRTAGRRDFSLPPHGPTLLNLASDGGGTVLAIGKIFDLYAGSGIGRRLPSKSNAQTIELLLRALSDQDGANEKTGIDGGIILANLVDFDMLFGHRNDPSGFAQALVEFDAALPEILGCLDRDDFLVITADHGNDPTTPGTDHTREYVPLLAFGQSITGNRNLGTRESFADAGAAMAEFLGLPPLGTGRSFLKEIIN